MPHRNAYMTDELQAIYEQTVEFVTKEVRPKGDQWEEEGRVPREILRQTCPAPAVIAYLWGRLLCCAEERERSTCEPYNLKTSRMNER